MKKIIAIFCIALQILPFSCIMASAESEYDYQEENIISDENAYSLGVIDVGRVECSVGTKKIHIKCSTYCTYSVSEVGFKNIIIQRSSDRVNWTEEKRINSLTTYNNSYYYLSDYVVWVNGGYYYQVKLDHYAYNGTSEYQSNTSNSVWIS